MFICYFYFLAVVAVIKDTLDRTVNSSVLCVHNKLGLRPMGRVVVVTAVCWNAIQKVFPEAISLPFKGGSDRINNCDNEDLMDAWLCSECQADRQQGADECTSQKASRTLELTDSNLLTLYNTKRGRNNNSNRVGGKRKSWRVTG